MAELTRHRLASFCVESQRYVTISGDIAFIQPVFYRKGEIGSEHWHSFMAAAEESYHRLLDSG